MLLLVPKGQEKPEMGTPSWESGSTPEPRTGPKELLKRPTVVFFASRVRPSFHRS